MELLVADQYRSEIGYITVSKKFDLDIGKDNDFELTLDLTDWAKFNYVTGYYVYIYDTEFGGIIKNIKTDTKANTIKLIGRTWRGMMEKKIIEPPTGLAYRTITGEANDAMREVLGTMLEPLFVVDDVDSGFTVNYQFIRYTDVLSGFMAMLKEVGARLQITFESDLMVHLKAVSIQDYSNTLEYSQDSNVYFTTEVVTNKVNHLIALGSGDLTDKQVLHLYLQADGTIGTVQYYTGIDEVVEIYDYSSAESLDDLTAKATEYFLEEINYSKIEVDVSDISAEIGDIVGGRERVTGLTIAKPIVQKIFKINGTKETIQMKVEG